MSEEKDPPSGPPPGQPVLSPGWEAWITRTTAILAILAAVSSGRWGASNLAAILEQGKVTNGWAFYQAKSIKQHGAEEIAQLAQALAKDVASEKAPTLQALAAKFQDEAKRLDAEKKGVKSGVESDEARRDRMIDSSFWYEVAFATLQFSVILSTIAAGTKRRRWWAAAIVTGTAGLLLVVNGYLGIVQAPGSLAKKLGVKVETEALKNATPAPTPAPPEDPGK